MLKGYLKFCLAKLLVHLKHSGIYSSTVPFHRGIVRGIVCGTEHATLATPRPIFLFEVLCCLLELPLVVLWWLRARHIEWLGGIVLLELLHRFVEGIAIICSFNGRFVSCGCHDGRVSFGEILSSMPSPISSTNIIRSLLYNLLCLLRGLFFFCRFLCALCRLLWAWCRGLYFLCLGELML